MAEIKPILSIVEKAAQDGLREVAKATLKLARELSPTDTGASDKSGFVVVDDLTAQVGFKSQVSRIEHEDLEVSHPNGGQAKFLEAAAEQVGVGQTVAVGFRRSLRG